MKFRVLIVIFIVILVGYVTVFAMETYIDMQHGDTVTLICEGNMDIKSVYGGVTVRCKKRKNAPVNDGTFQIFAGYPAPQEPDQHVPSYP